MIEKIFILSFLTFAIHATLQEGMIFEKLGIWLENTFGEYWSKPMGMCPVCSGFWHGLILYWVLPYWEHNILDSVVIAVSVIGLNWIFTKIFPDKEIEIKLPEEDEKEAK